LPLNFVVFSASSVRDLPKRRRPKSSKQTAPIANIADPPSAVKARLLQ